MIALYLEGVAARTRWRAAGEGNSYAALGPSRNPPPPAPSQWFRKFLPVVRLPDMAHKYKVVKARLCGGKMSSTVGHASRSMKRPRIV